MPAALAAAAAAGKEAGLQQELETLFRAENRSTDSQSFLIPVTYLRVTVMR